MKHYLLLLLIFISVTCAAQVWTNKTIANEIVLNKTNITIGFNTKKNIANYVGEILTSNMIKGSATRTKFTPDYCVSLDNRITTDMYTNSGYDRGHLAPAADFKYNQKVMNECFMMTNICPQNPKLNQKYWLKLEDYVRSLTTKCDTIFVITGTIGSKGSIYNKKITIPSKIYKAVIGVKNGQVNLSCAWIYVNDDSNQNITATRVTINKLEQTISRDLFYKLNKRYPIEKNEGKILIP